MPRSVVSERFPVLYYIAIALGFVLTNLGFWLNSEKGPPAGTWGLLMLFVGLGLTFGGILLASVPDFFAS